MVRIDADVSGIENLLDDGESFGGGSTGGDSFASTFDALFIIVPVLIVGAIVLMVVLAVVNARRLRSKGISPLATKAEIVADAVRGSSAQLPGSGPAAGTAQTLESRLEEIERLHAAGTITEVERDAARTRLLGTI